MNVLSAMNLCLPYLQAPQATEESSRHPMAVRLRSSILGSCRLVLARGWWFNTVVLTLAPDGGGRIPVPQNALETTPLDLPRAEARGGYLYNLQECTPFFSESLSARVVQNLGFDECPELFQHMIAWQAAHEVYCTRFDAGDGTGNLLLGRAQEAAQFVLREHLRHMQYSTATSGAASRIVNSIRGL